MFLDFDWMSLCFICSYISANYWAQTGVSLLNNSKCKYMKPIHAVGFKKKKLALVIFLCLHTSWFEVGMSGLEVMPTTTQK